MLTKIHGPCTAAIKRSICCTQAVSKRLAAPCVARLALPPPTGEKRRLVSLKINGKKFQDPNGKYAATWEEHPHKKRPRDFYEDNNDNAPTA